MKDLNLNAGTKNLAIIHEAVESVLGDKIVVGKRSMAAIRVQFTFFAMAEEQICFNLKIKATSTEASMFLEDGGFTAEAGNALTELCDIEVIDSVQVEAIR